jgi:hypothetical protein
MDEALLDKIRLSLPQFLSAESKSELIDQLQQYPDNRNYYGTIPGESEPVQGDAWTGFVALDFETAERDRVVGFVISNSCDIAAANAPADDQCILFAPILPLSRYAEMVLEAGDSPDQIESELDAIRKQSISRLFYLPAMTGHHEESVVPLDRLFAQPLRMLNQEAMQRFFTLNLYGWYILLIKLSIHFTRMGEAVPREQLTAEASSAGRRRG